MAKYSAVTEAEVNFTTAKTVMNVTGSATADLEVTGIGIAFDGVTSTAEPVIVRIVRTTSPPTVTACTEKAWHPPANTPIGAAGYNASGEGTKETVSLITTEVHPQGGSFVLSWPKGEGIVVPGVANAGLSIECTAAASVNCHAWIEWWE